MAQIKEFNITNLKSIIQDIHEMVEFLDTGKKIFIIAEEQQEITLIEIRKKVEMTMTIFRI